MMFPLHHISNQQIICKHYEQWEIWILALLNGLLAS